MVLPLHSFVCLVISAAVAGAPLAVYKIDGDECFEGALDRDKQKYDIDLAGLKEGTCSSLGFINEVNTQILSIPLYGEVAFTKLKKSAREMALRKIVMAPFFWLLGAFKPMVPPVAAAAKQNPSPSIVAEAPRAASSADNERMVAQLFSRPFSQGVITKDSVQLAMLAVDRKNYVLSDDPAPYWDTPRPLIHDATISAPHMHAWALQLLSDHLKLGASVLDVGSGSGYLSACMAEMVGATGTVIGIDYLEPLVDLSIKNVKKADAHLLESGQLILRQGDGWRGAPAEAPFDCIHVGAAAAEVPQALLDQLKPGGRMVIPVGANFPQYYHRIDKALDGSIHSEKLFGVRYVPLVRTPEQEVNV